MDACNIRIIKMRRYNLSAHEHVIRSIALKPGSNRNFGLIFTAVFFVIGIWPTVYGAPVRAWSLWVAISFLLITLLKPNLLQLVNRMWFKFGLLLHRIISPVVMALLFFLTLTPTALLMRLFGKRPLGLEFDKRTESYWIHRTPPGPEPDSMKNQF